jgi:hypothetical protein
MGQTNGFRLHGESNKAFQKITEVQSQIMTSLKQQNLLKLGSSS